MVWRTGLVSMPVNSLVSWRRRSSRDILVMPASTALRPRLPRTEALAMTAFDFSPSRPAVDLVALGIISEAAFFFFFPGVSSLLMDQLRLSASMPSRTVVSTPEVAGRLGGWVSSTRVSPLMLRRLRGDVSSPLARRLPWEDVPLNLERLYTGRLLRARRGRPESGGAEGVCSVVVPAAAVDGAAGSGAGVVSTLMPSEATEMLSEKFVGGVDVVDATCSEPESRGAAEMLLWLGESDMMCGLGEARRDIWCLRLFASSDSRGRVL